MSKRYAVIEGPPKTIQRYMPDNYRVVGVHENGTTTHCYIEGEDFAGWTLDGYVKPRLESGLWFGLTELDSDLFTNITPWEE